MSGDTERCPECGRLVNVFVNGARCPHCGDYTFLPENDDGDGA